MRLVSGKGKMGKKQIIRTWAYLCHIGVTVSLIIPFVLTAIVCYGEGNGCGIFIIFFAPIPICLSVILQIIAILIGMFAHETKLHILSFCSLLAFSPTYVELTGFGPKNETFLSSQGKFFFVYLLLTSIFLSWEIWKTRKVWRIFPIAGLMILVTVVGWIGWRWL